VLRDNVSLGMKHLKELKDDHPFRVLMESYLDECDKIFLGDFNKGLHNSPYHLLLSMSLDHRNTYESGKGFRRALKIYKRPQSAMLRLLNSEDEITRYIAEKRLGV